MNILLLDTSGPVCGAAVVQHGKLTGEMNFLSGRKHSVQAMPILDSLLSYAGLELADIDVFSAVAGPGSFTGIRIGVAAIAGLAEAQGKPCFALGATEALAAGAGWFDGLVCPIIDARPPRVYTALFRPGVPPERLTPDRQTTTEELLNELQSRAGRVLFVGDAAKIHFERIRAELAGRAVNAPEHLSFLRAGAACVLASEKIQGGSDLVDPAMLRAVYLQPSQAERKEKERAAL